MAVISLAPYPSRRTGMPQIAWFLFTIFTVLALLASGAHADCYWPDGTENDEHQPCYSPHGGAIGLCCSTGDVCLSNGVCMSRGDSVAASTSSDLEDTENSLSSAIYYRGSCTYKTWSEGENCPTMCIKGAGIPPHTDVGIIPCPGSDTNWYCADSNMNKANCSSGAFIVSLAKPVMFTTIGISPSKTMHTPAPTTTLTSTSTTATATASSDDSAPTTGLITAPGNASSPGTAPTGFSSAVSGSSPVASPTSGSPSSSSSSTAAPPPPLPGNPNSASNVPLAVGVTIGGASIVAAIVIGFFLWRRRKRDEPAPAESPPPRDVPDDDILHSVLEGSMFRSGSLLSRRPSKTYLNGNMGGGDGQPGQPPPPMPDSGSVFSGHQRSSSYQRADSLHSGSMLSSFHKFQQNQQQQQQHQQQQEYQQFQQQQHPQQQQQQHRQSYEAPVPLHQPHPQRHHGYPQARFSPDAVAMHNLRRTPPVAWGHRGDGPSVTSEPIPEIPYDPRRMAPYHGVPMMEHNNYSELPG